MIEPWLAWAMTGGAFLFGGLVGVFAGVAWALSDKSMVTVRQRASVGNGGVVVQTGNVRIANQGNKKPDAGRCEYCGAQK